MWISLNFFIQGRFDTSCSSKVGLDNNDEIDYKNGHTALFDGKPDNDGSDDGMGGCKGVCTSLFVSQKKMASFFKADLNYGLIGGTATWLGEGTWSAAGQKAICIDFYDPDVSFLFRCFAWYLSLHILYRMTNQHAAASWSLEPWVRTNPLNSRTVIVKCEKVLCGDMKSLLRNYKYTWTEHSDITSYKLLLLLSKKYSFQEIVHVNFVKDRQIRQFKSCSNTQGRVSCVKTLKW